MGAEHPARGPFTVLEIIRSDRAKAISGGTVKFNKTRNLSNGRLLVYLHFIKEKQLQASRHW